MQWVFTLAKTGSFEIRSDAIFKKKMVGEDKMRLILKAPTRSLPLQAVGDLTAALSGMVQRSSQLLPSLL